MRSKMARILLPCVAVALAWAGTARAGLLVAIGEDGSLPGQVIDLPSGSSTTLSGSYLNAPDFTFAGFGVNSTLGATQGELGG